MREEKRQTRRMLVAAEAAAADEVENSNGPICVFDERVLNNNTFPLLHDIGITFFASLCGRNRGVFVTQPSDGQTWGCLSMPPDLATLANVTESTESNTDPNKNIHYTDANDIKNQFLAGNVSSADTVKVLNYFLKAVYWSSDDDDTNLYGCELSGLATLRQCEFNPKNVSTINDSSTSTSASNTDASDIKLQVPIRSVTMAGVFIPSPFVGTAEIPFEAISEGKNAFYSIHDFHDMKALGINTVQIPFPLREFISGTTSPSAKLQYLSKIFNMIKTVGSIQVILTLKINPTISPPLTDEQIDMAITAAAQYCMKKQQDSLQQIVALTIPSASVHQIQTARAATSSLSATYPKLVVFIPIDQGDLIKPIFIPDGSTFGSLDLEHSTSVADIASSTSFDDRNKMFYHESKACIYRSPLEYSACYHNIPVFVSRGFDISIDDCINSNDVEDFVNTTAVSPLKKMTTAGGGKFVDYGQCHRFHETINSPWWLRHRTSFLKRQMFSYEQGLGWSYTTWKLYNDVASTNPLLDEPAKLLSFKNVAAAGIVPAHDNKYDSFVDACLNPPDNDFVMGDATYTPSATPLPNCWPGWWNTTIMGCTYWVPPPVSPPTPNPSPEPKIITIYVEKTTVPSSSSIMSLSSTSTASASMAEIGRMTSSSSPSTEYNIGHMTLYGSIGIVVGVVLSLIVTKRRRHQQGYSTIE